LGQKLTLPSYSEVHSQVVRWREDKQPHGLRSSKQPYDLSEQPCA